MHVRNKGKLDPRAIKCIVMRYSSTQEGYMCYHPLHIYVYIYMCVCVCVCVIIHHICFIKKDICVNHPPSIYKRMFLSMKVNLIFLLFNLKGRIPLTKIKIRRALRGKKQKSRTPTSPKQTLKTSFTTQPSQKIYQRIKFVNHK